MTKKRPYGRGFRHLALAQGVCRAAHDVGLYPQAGVVDKREIMLEFDLAVKRFRSLTALNGCSFAAQHGRSPD